MKRVALVVCAGAALLAVCAGPVWGSEARQVVREGPLGITVGNVSLPSVTLSGTTQSVSGTAGSEWVAQDARGTGNGWSVTVAASGNLTSAAGVVETTARTLPIGNLAMTPGSATAKPGSDPATNISTTAVTLSTSAQTFVTCSSLCKGRYGFTPSFTLVVPANAFRSNYAGAVDASALNPYTATLTFTIA